MVKNRLAAFQLPEQSKNGHVESAAVNGRTDKVGETGVNQQEVVVGNLVPALLLPPVLLIPPPRSVPDPSRA